MEAPKPKIFNILTIDGGGIRGLYAAKALEQIERQYGPLINSFNLICGTSTGGLIALGLSLGLSAQQLANFYSKRGDKIFPRKHWLTRGYGFARQAFFNGYSSKKLRREVIAIFGEELTMSDCKVPTCIFSYNISKGEPIVFKSPHQHADYVRDGNLPIVDVAMATASAPTFFRNHHIDHDHLPDTLCTDGGVWCNNPSLAGLLEARTHFVGNGKPFDSIRVLSISTAPKPSGKQRKGGGLLRWKGDMMGAAIQGQSFFANRFLNNLNDNPESGVSYRRIAPKNLSIEQQKLLEMDLASPKALNQLARLGTDCGQHFVTQQAAWLSSVFQ
ncbi:CBASS cGAMP-activated phospholipase [Neolewinella agarilytica]|uniref:Patatin-like phospholipase n=1 Tax=Neolewinella agarilytica TaxID=478744 RepID=A0A1H9HDA1_9BACT|nr:CBASS cGAMP-activated phospholipase [Neolewinella agarilytica]SEQ60264.1 Patatin-like phospholipase [Neolewinella agarilytica]